MKLHFIKQQLFPYLLSASILLSLSACSSAPANPANSAAASVASSVAEPPLSETHPFAYSDATWETTPTEIEDIMGKAPDSVSFAGEAKKNYVFEDVEYGTAKGKCSYTFKDDTLCISTFTTESSQVLTDASNAFVENLTKVYGEATEDKSDTDEDGAGVWLEWTTDDISVSYLYYINPDTKKYQIVLSYSLPENKLPVIDASNRNGDFRTGFWGDDEDTINKYETAKFEGPADDGSALLYSGSVAGNDAYIVYYFDPAGKLYRGLYGITTTYSTASLYITSYETLKDSLSEKYGKPSSDEVRKISSLAKYADADTALQLGYSVYQTIWNTETTEVSLGMLNDGSGISILISYTDPNHEEVKNTSGL